MFQISKYLNDKNHISYERFVFLDIYYTIMMHFDFMSYYGLTVTAVPLVFVVF